MYDSYSASFGIFCPDTVVFQPTVQSLFTWSLEYDRSLGRLNTIASPLVDPSFHSSVVDADFQIVRGPGLW